IEAYGTDSLRFTFAALATQGRDIRFDVGRIQGYRNFCNKLWNAARYVFMTLDQHGIDIHADARQTGLAERWINTRLSMTISEVLKSIEAYRFDLAAQAMYEFTWDEYCDWYLELSKISLNDEQVPEDVKRGTLFTLVNVLETLLRLMHPIIPFITEELWQRTASIMSIKADTIMLQAYPEAADLETDEAALDEIEWIKSFILGVRRIRAERDIPPGKKLPVQHRDGNDQELHWLNDNRETLLSLGRLESINASDADPGDAVAALAGDMTLLIPLADLIDPAEELQRLHRELDRLEQEQERIQAKLENQNFISKAPEAVVNKERDKLNDAQSSLEKLRAQKQRLEAMAE
ncbi:MAG: class I tRNA ligase family protein, partial [Thiotrichales bacterium]|nr:class I tRNA ligase family protein [Thiotrichales bacterium]